MSELSPAAFALARSCTIAAYLYVVCGLVHGPSPSLKIEEVGVPHFLIVEVDAGDTELGRECHPEMAAASVCAQEKGRWTPGSGGSSCCRNHRRAIRQGGGGGEVEDRVVAAAFVLDVREVRLLHRLGSQLS